MVIKAATKEQLVAAYEASEDKKADAFIKTFIGKADKQDMWKHVRGAYNDADELCGAIITTVSKGEPKSANLQLMVTFSKYRGQGVGKWLVEDSFSLARVMDCKYFRVSAERTAVGFYQKCGIPFLGLQKSGTFLALFNLAGPRESLDEYIIDKALRKNGKIFIDRCENPNKKEKETIEKLGTAYLYPRIKEWNTQVTPSSS